MAVGAFGPAILTDTGNQTEVAATSTVAEIIALGPSEEELSGGQLSVVSVEGLYKPAFTQTPSEACASLSELRPDALSIARYSSETIDEMRLLSEADAKKLIEQAEQAKSYEELYEVIRAMYASTGVEVNTDQNFDPRLLKLIRPANQLRSVDQAAVINHIDMLKNVPYELISHINRLNIRNTGMENIPRFEKDEIRWALGYAYGADITMPISNLGTRVFFHELGHAIHHQVCQGKSPAVDTLFNNNSRLADFDIYDILQSDSLSTSNKMSNPGYSTRSESNINLRRKGFVTNYARTSPKEFFAETFEEMMVRGRYHMGPEVSDEEVSSVQLVENIVDSGVSFDFGAYLDRKSQHIKGKVLNKIGNKTLSSLSLGINKYDNPVIKSYPVAKIRQADGESYIYAQFANKSGRLELDFPTRLSETDRKQIVDIIKTGLEANLLHPNSSQGREVVRSVESSIKSGRTHVGVYIPKS